METVGVMLGALMKEQIRSRGTDTLNSPPLSYVHVSILCLESEESHKLASKPLDIDKAVRHGVWAAGRVLWGVDCHWHVLS